MQLLAKLAVDRSVVESCSTNHLVLVIMVFSVTRRSRSDVGLVVSIDLTDVTLVIYDTF